MELPRLKTKEAREKSYDAALGSVGAYGVPFKKAPEFLKLINSERKYLGFEGYIR